MEVIFHRGEIYTRSRSLRAADGMKAGINYNSDSDASSHTTVTIEKSCVECSVHLLQSRKQYTVSYCWNATSESWFTLETLTGITLDGFAQIEIMDRISGFQTVGHALQKCGILLWYETYLSVVIRALDWNLVRLPKESAWNTKMPLQYITINIITEDTEKQLKMPCRGAKIQKSLHLMFHGQGNLLLLF